MRLHRESHRAPLSKPSERLSAPQMPPGLRKRAAQARRRHPGAHIIVGTRGADVLRGTRGRDIIIGGGGRDVIRARGGNDVILIGGQGRKGPRVKVYGGKGRDEIRARGGSDILKGGKGADRIFGGYGRDKIIGGAGRDDLHGQNQNDLIRAGAGNDHVTGSSGKDRIYGAKGRDAITGGPGNDVVRGGLGDDVLHLYTGNDRGYGGKGYDWLGGFKGNDVLVGGPGKDIGSDIQGRNRIRTELGRHTALPGHPLYNPPDDRRVRNLPNLRGVGELRRAIERLRWVKAISSADERAALMEQKRRLAHAAQRAVSRRYHGIRRKALAQWRLDQLLNAYSSEVDRLTVAFQHRQQEQAHAKGKL